ncbi:MAG: hypothetical protein K0S86_4838 [Geminicoccaceae bacterium]|nr:hypothetical protein [Geminicoccaceae bacterium]
MSPTPVDRTAAPGARRPRRSSPATGGAGPDDDGGRGAAAAAEERAEVDYSVVSPCVWSDPTVRVLVAPCSGA